MNIKQHVKFKYYWPEAGENGEALAFYSLPINNGFSDVTAETLKEKGIHVPKTPSFITWDLHIKDKQKCGLCYISVRSVSDLTRHLEIQHGIKKNF
jgi:hypothetical protein